MTVVIDNKCSLPIYDQIYSQIKAQIISGELQEHEALPSIRNLAKDLRNSVITTKRAYEELERDGFIISQTGKGSFVAGTNVELVREAQLQKIEQQLMQAVETAHISNISLTELQEMLTLLYGGEES